MSTWSAHRARSCRTSRAARPARSGSARASASRGRTHTPTLREHGIDAVYYSWRGFLAPRSITPAQGSFWEQAFAKVV
jgi:tripartite-type tricarboxylate transporter receptor subunit TctC